MDPHGRKSKNVSDAASPGELVFENGPEAGRRWPLHAPTTFVGSAAGCDLRLAENGIDPFHCLFVAGPDGLVLRDLESTKGTLVNGHRIGAAELKNGDRVRIGPIEVILVLKKPGNEAAAVILPTPAKRQRDGMRVQIAAVAAQQAANDEEESRLVERAADLRTHEEQATHRVEEKRRKLQKAQENVQAERQALLRDRLSYERHIERITGSLSVAQRELLQQQRHVETERARLTQLLASLKERYRRQNQEAADRIEKKEKELAERETKIREGEERLRQKRLKFNGDFELGRHHLRESWGKLKQAQLRWKHRRGNERAALKVFARDLEEAEIDLHQAVQKFDQERKVWETHKESLSQELVQLDERVRSQRHLLSKMDDDLRASTEELLRRRATLGGIEAREASTTSDGQGERDLLRISYLSEELADQRQMVAEHRHRLGLLQASWQEDRDRTIAELEAAAAELAETESALRRREEGCAEAEHQLARRREAVAEMRTKIFARTAELKVREASWEAERDRLLAEVQHREELAEQGLAALVDLRHRWAKRRQSEVERLNEERSALTALRQELDREQMEMNKRLNALDDQKRLQAERHLALEQLRQEIVGRADSETERKLERLRRRWLSHNAGVLRTIAAERSSQESERQALDQRFLELQQRLERLQSAEDELQQKILAWEHQQAIVQARHSKLESAAHLAVAQKAVLEKQLAQLKDQVERIAKNLLDEPESLSDIERAA